MPTEANGSRCPMGIRNEARTRTLQRDIEAMASHIDRLEERQTQCEITVAGIATRVTMWASLGVTAATVVIQLVFNLLR